MRLYRRPSAHWLALTAAVLLALSAGARAQTSPSAVSWDCWVSLSEAIAIRCIAAREGIPPADPALDDMQTVLLDHIHTLIHAGSTVAIDGIVANNLEVFKDGSIWTIRIWNIPYDSSWAEDRPTRLVRAVLCPRDVACKVMVTRP